MREINEEVIKDLTERADRLRREVIQMVGRAGIGTPWRGVVSSRHSGVSLLLGDAL